MHSNYIIIIIINNISGDGICKSIRISNVNKAEFPLVILFSH